VETGNGEKFTPKHLKTQEEVGNQLGIAGLEDTRLAEVSYLAIEEQLGRDLSYKIQQMRFKVDDLSKDLLDLSKIVGGASAAKKRKKF
jgi:hypothetical protein